MAFWHTENISSTQPALVDSSGINLTYGELTDCVQAVAKDIPERALVFIFCNNDCETVIGYLACLRKNAVALMLDSDLDNELLSKLIDTYRPTLLWRADGDHYRLQPTGLTPWPMHESLALLVTTSGSTGSPKLVRLSQRSLESNAISIKRYLEIESRERGLVSLPVNYVYGLSIINSHLCAGATLLLTRDSVMQREFWQFVHTEQASSLSGVPYTWEMLKRLRFMQMNLPYLRTLTQAGGKLAPAAQQEYTDYAERCGKKFIVMYGAAEATSRMSWLAPEHARCKYGSIGRAIPGGEFLLLDANGQVITTPDTEGELLYCGENVALGYAQCGEDLALGDIFGGTLHTGDIARFDSEGFYTIVGRKKRFLKIFGNRVGLDEMEALLKTAFPGMACACEGRDDLLCIFITETSLVRAVKQYASEISKIHHSAFRVIVLEEIPKNAAGKTLYHRLKDHVLFI